MTTFNKDELAMLHKLFIEIYKNGFNNSPEEAKKALSLLDTEYDDLGVKPSHIHASGEKQKKAMKLLLEHIVEVLEDEDVDFNLENQPCYDRTFNR